MSFWQSIIDFIFAAPPVKSTGVDSALPPPWIQQIAKVEGLHETRDKAKLSKWLKSDGITLGDPTKLPWCGDAVDTAMELALPNEPRPGDLGKNPYWALNWLYFGKALKEPVYGAVVVFKRPSGGHVGFIVGQNETHYEVFGGNQSDSVSKVFIEKSRCVGIRWPSTYTGNKTPVPYRKLGTVSKNEA